MEVFLVLSQVIRKFFDLTSEESDLRFCRTSVSLVSGYGLKYVLLYSL
jgi:hypothetical protein